VGTLLAGFVIACMYVVHVSSIYSYTEIGGDELDLLDLSQA